MSTSVNLASLLLAIFLTIVWQSSLTMAWNEVIDILTTRVRIWKICHRGPRCQFVWILQVVYISSTNSCLSNNERKLWLLWFYPTLTLSYVWLSKATNMLISIITDKTKNIKYKAATTFVVNLVWDSNFCKSAWLNTDKTSCQEVLNKLEVTKRKISMDNTFTCMYLTRSHCVNRKLKIEIEYT